MNEMENLLCLSGKRVIMDEDRVRWVELKYGHFLVKSLYKALDPDSCFLMKITWNSSVQPKVTVMRKSSNFGPSSEERLGFSK